MKRTIAVLVLALSLGATAALAQPAPAPRAPMHPQMHQQMMAKLNLTDAQKEQMAKLRAEFQKKMIAQRAKIQSLRVDLRTEIGADNPDRAAIEKTTKNISELQAQGKMDLIDHLFAVRSILTPEQQKTFKAHLMSLAGEMRERAMGRMMGRMGRMGHGMDNGGPDMPDMGE
ncbi:MAG: Spy/CpxP family protein refolding chaperone [Bacteroidota bacterium]